MKRTINKLKSNSGATIIIALLFMLICVFIGGSVLVAATVNGGRLEDKRADEQNLLTQRSVASFITAQMSSGGEVTTQFVFEGGTPTSKDSLKGFERALYLSVESARSALNSSHKGEKGFTVNTPDGTAVECLITTTESGSYVNSVISFVDDPVIRIVMQGSDLGGTVSWSAIKVEKGGA